MPSTSSTAIDERGFLFHLPQLGLNDPAGASKWARISVAYGSKAECFEHEDVNPEGAPLRNCSAKTKIFEVEIDGVVWYLPTWLHPTDEKTPEVFSLNVQLLPASVAPPSERSKMPDHIRWAFVSRMGRQLVMEFGAYKEEEEKERPKKSDEELLQGLRETFGLENPCMEGLQLFKRCSDTTPEQRKALPLPKSRAEAEENAAKMKPALATAKEIWLAMLPVSISREWHQQIQRDRAAIGLPAKPNELGISIRASPEPLDDIRGLDYALGEGDEVEDSKLKWMPLPKEAFDPKWVRCGVNLIRYGVYRDLYTKDDWPAWPTSLMIRKMGEAKGERY